MNKYLIAVLEDRIKAEEVYSALEIADFPMGDIAILGRGYKTADEFGLIDPSQEAWKQIRLMAFWLIPFGFGAGFLFDAITGLDTFPWVGRLGNQILGGILGAGSGALGSFVVGGGVGIAIGGGDATAYRNRLNDGKYLVVVKGSEALINQATRIMRLYKPETMQGYTMPSDNA